MNEPWPEQPVGWRAAMTDGPSTDDVRDIWVDHHLNPLPRAEGIGLVPEYQAAFDAWLESVRADERGRFRESMELAESEVRSHKDRWADLRAKVEALDESGDFLYRRAVEQVLDLIDGSKP